MQPKIDFYQISDEQVYQFACRLVNKIYQRGMNLLINLNDQQQYDYIDNLLWTFNDISFLPHAMAQADNPAPIHLSINIQTLNKHYDVLLNLAQAIPPCFQDFPRIAEIIPQDDDWKKLLRQHYKFYQQHSDELKLHTINR